MKDPGQDLNSVVSAVSAASMSSSLLDRLKAEDPDAWKRLVRLYYPLVRKWCQRSGLKHEDAADVAQEVFRALAGNVARFRREKGQTSFRGWLYGITSRQILAHWRLLKQRPVAAGGSEAQERLMETALWQDDGASEASAVLPADERQEVLRRALQMLRDGVENRTWEAFWRSVVDGQAPADIAADLGISVNAVYIAKARLLGRLREEFGELIR